MLFIGLTYSIVSSGQTGNAPKSVQTINWNDHIDLKSRNQIKIFDDQLISSFYDSNAQELVSLYSEGLNKKVADKTEGLVQTIHPLVRTKSYTVFDECLFKSSAIWTESSVSKNNLGDNNYKVNFKVFTKETYISLLTFKEQFNEWLITSIYGKYDGKWELDEILIGKFKVAGKNAVDLYKHAMKDYSENDLIGTANYMFVSKMVAAPAGDDFIYFKTPEIENFRNKVQRESISKLVFPIEVKGIKTLPQIFGIQPEVNNEGVFPSVNYLTKINLKELVQLQSENEQVKEKIREIFPGINKNKRYVFFKVFNQIPNQKNNAGHFEFVWKTYK
jgi:hypothetical protein